MSIDILDLIDESIENSISSDEINRLNLYGIFPLILSYINIFKKDVNFYNFSNLIYSKK